MKSTGLLALALGLLLVPASTMAGAPPLVTETVHFEIPATDVIPGLVSMRASCDLLASGEDLVVLADDTVRTTVGAEPGPCSVILNFFGLTDLQIAQIATTPLGTLSVFIPGVSIATLGIVDISLELRTSLNSTTRVSDPQWASPEPENRTWDFWGTTRVLITTAEGFGSVVDTDLTTSFTYRMILSLNVLALGIPIPGLSASLVDFGAHEGAPSLVTDLVVDLVPVPPVLAEPANVAHDGATIAWTLAAPTDLDHVEVWVSDEALNVSYRVEPPTATSLRVPASPSTTYRAWVVAVDEAGQSSVSRVVTFTTPAAPSSNPTDDGVQPQGEPPYLWVIVALLAGGALVAALLWGLRRPPKD